MEVIYRHSSMDLTRFNSNCLNKLLEHIYKEQKDCSEILMLIFEITMSIIQLMKF